MFVANLVLGGVDGAEPGKRSAARLGGYSA
jgi:hypothetical protein